MSTLWQKKWRDFLPTNPGFDENGENFLLISCFSQIQVLEILHVNFAVACQSNVVRPGWYKVKFVWWDSFQLASWILFFVKSILNKVSKFLSKFKFGKFWCSNFDLRHDLILTKIDQNCNFSQILKIRHF